MKRGSTTVSPYCWGSPVAVSPGVVATEFGINAAYGGPDSRGLPMSQPVEEVAEVIERVIDTRASDVYTRRGMRQMVLDYFGRMGADPA